MQNLSISCALVCLIILGSAALVGSFGICQRQISAILVTGVMYLLAGNSRSCRWFFNLITILFSKNFPNGHFCFLFLNCSTFCVVHTNDHTF